MLLMFMLIFVGGTPAMQGVVEEKMQRIAEMVLGSVRPFELMMGKLLGLMGVSLTLPLFTSPVRIGLFGAAVVSSIGSLGLESALIPLVAYSRAPIVIAAGAVSDEPVVEDGKVVPGKVMRIGATFDHRVIDGSHAAVMADTIRRAIEQPWTLEPSSIERRVSVG